MRNNLRQLPALTISRKPGGNLRGWDLTIDRKEEPHLWQSINNGDKNKVRGLYIVEQAATDSFTDIL